MTNRHRTTPHLRDDADNRSPAPTRATGSGTYQPRKWDDVSFGTLFDIRSGTVVLRRAPAVLGPPHLSPYDPVALRKDGTVTTDLPKTAADTSPEDFHRICGRASRVESGRAVKEAM